MARTQSKHHNANNYKGDRPKKSGFKVASKTDKNGGIVASGWLKSGRDLITFSIKTSYKDGKAQIYKGEENGNTMHKVVIQYGKKFESNYTSGTYHAKTGKVTCKPLNLCFTPNGGGRTKSGKFVKGAIVTLSR